MAAPLLAEHPSVCFKTTLGVPFMIMIACCAIFVGSSKVNGLVRMALVAHCTFGYRLSARIVSGMTWISNVDDLRGSWLLQGLRPTLHVGAGFEVYLNPCPDKPKPPHNCAIPPIWGPHRSTKLAAFG
jgi:hypothetical protein